MNTTLVGVTLHKGSSSFPLRQLCIELTPLGRTPHGAFPLGLNSVQLHLFSSYIQADTSPRVESTVLT